MLYVGLDLSRRRLDFDVLLPDGGRLERGVVPPDVDGLASLVQRLDDANEPGVCGDRVDERCAVCS